MCGFLSGFCYIHQVYAYVDNEEYEAKWTTTGNFTDITSRVMFVGGAPDVRQLNGSKATQNFFGCLRAVSKPKYFFNN